GLRERMRARPRWRARHAQGGGGGAVLLRGGGRGGGPFSGGRFPPAATASSFSILTSRRGGRRSRHGRTARARFLPDADPRAGGCRGSGATAPSLSRPAPVHARRGLGFLRT